MNARKEMPMFFSRKERKIYFQYRNMSLEFSRIKTNIHVPTLIKLVEGLNHFLMYFYLYDIDSYYKVCDYLFNKNIIIQNDTKLELTVEQFLEKQIQLVCKHAIIERELLGYTCDYINHTYVNNADSKSLTDIKFQDIHIKLLTVATVAIKFSFLYSTAFLGTNNKFDDAMTRFIDPLMYEIGEVASNYFEFVNNDGTPTTPEIVRSEIDTFLQDRIEVVWLKKSDSSFRRKFEEIGKDTIYYQAKNKILVYTAFKQYVPPITRDPAIIDKYKGMQEDTPDMNLIYTYSKDFDDFKFYSLNLSSYIHNTIGNIITKQDTRATRGNVNSPEFLSDTTDERSLRKDIALYEDKVKYLFELRKDTSLDVFKLFCTEIKRMMKIHNITNASFIGKFKLTKEHYFNQFILTKILLAITGEHTTYKKVFGEYSKFILLLFYLKVMYEDELAWLRHIINVMLCEPVGVEDESPEIIREFLDSEGYSTIPVQSFSLICRLYTDSNYQYKISKETLLDLYDFLSDSYKLRNLLFPIRYPIPEDSNVYDNNYEENTYINNEGVQSIIDTI